MIRNIFDITHVLNYFENYLNLENVAQRRDLIQKLILTAQFILYDNTDIHGVDF